MKNESAKTFDDFKNSYSLTNYAASVESQRIEVDFFCQQFENNTFLKSINHLCSQAKCYNDQ